MKKVVLLFFSLLPLFAIAKTTVKGSVNCDGVGVSGVVVSDGVEVCVTDAHGKYKLDSQKKNGLVFISVPSGYTVDADGIIPRHFVHLKGGKSCEKADFQLKKEDNVSFSLLVFTDLHLTGDKQDDDIRQFQASFLPEFISSYHTQKGPVYTICLGDMTTDGKWYVNNFALPEYKAKMSSYPGSIFHLMGNHDNERKLADGQEVKDWESYGESTYRKEMGPNYYSFNIGKVHFLMLDNIVTYGPGCKKQDKYDWLTSTYGFRYFIDEEQLDWAIKDLSFVPKDNNVVLCMHVPFYEIKGLENGELEVEEYSKVPEALMKVVGEYNKVDILFGHNHKNQVFDIAPNVTVHLLPSASAVSWKLNDVKYPNLGNPLVCEDGTPAGYHIFHFDGNDVQWQYKSNYHSVNMSQCSVYDLNKFSPDYGGEPGSNAVLINVFNWDPMWKVKAYEDGEEMQLEQICGKDPLYRQVRAETKLLPTRPKAFLASPTVHLFRTVRKTSTSNVQVMIIDRFGNEYSAPLGYMAE